jgi:hypothetical protein
MFNIIINLFSSLFTNKTIEEQKLFKAQDYEVSKLWRKHNDSK